MGHGTYCSPARSWSRSEVHDIPGMRGTLCEPGGSPRSPVPCAWLVEPPFPLAALHDSHCTLIRSLRLRKRRCSLAHGGYDKRCSSRRRNGTNHPVHGTLRIQGCRPCRAARDSPCMMISRSCGLRPVHLSDGLFPHDSYHRSHQPLHCCRI